MINLIAVLNNKRAIGKKLEDGTYGLIFDLPKDLSRFRTLTKGQPVIMGPTTYESLPELVRPLPGRLNIVVSRRPDYEAPGAEVVHTIEEALTRAKESTNGDVWVIGGGAIYSLALPHADRLYLTIVDDDSEGDAYFPDYGEFSEIIPNDDESENGTHEENGLQFRFETRARPSAMTS
jgi:dihydrofolate reductase